ncbi:hypothetical protein [Leptothermofonsia sp. ETS-13]|uniref:hypothetical protein n=1 Tax=Leptothermofonsia sp. ETS-13 TaxID=3035696 RepID=UPI003B9F2C74
MNSVPLEVQWTAINDTIRRFNTDQKFATEYEVCGIAVLIMPRLTNLTTIERAVKGKGSGSDRLLCLLVSLWNLKLDQWHHQSITISLNLHRHVLLTLILRCHAYRIKRTTSIAIVGCYCRQQQQNGIQRYQNQRPGVAYKSP